MLHSFSFTLNDDDMETLKNALWERMKFDVFICTSSYIDDITKDSLKHDCERLAHLLNIIFYDNKDK